MTSTLGGKGIAALLRLERCGKCTGNQGGKEDGGVSERGEERESVNSTRRTLAIPAAENKTASTSREH